MPHTNVKVIVILVPEKMMFKGFSIYGRGYHLDHVKLTICTHFHSSFP